MKILLYVRPETADYFEVLSFKAFDNPSITTVCDFKNIGDIWLGEALYNSSINEILLDENTYFDIRSRCRFLRSIEYSKAIEIINKYWLNVEKIFENGNYDLVMGQIIDNYCMDIIDRIARKYNIPVISFSPTFIQGYSRFTVRGELVSLNRSVPDEESEKIINSLLEPQYKARYAGMSSKSVLKAYKWYIRRFLIERYYYPLKKFLSKDKLNYHYNTIYLNRGNIFDYVGPKINKYFQTISDISDYENSIYLPLHVVPEASTDYWGENPKFGYYEDLIIDFIKNTDKNIKIIVKEHPAIFGKRYIDFYRNLTSFNNVILIDPFEDSNALLKKITNVLVCTGSVGIESLLRNKRVFTLTKNYYSSLHPNIYKVNSISLQDLNNTIHEYDNKKFVRDLLDGLFNANICAEREIMNSDLDQIADYIKFYADKQLKNN